MANLDSSKVVVLAGSSLVLYGAYQIGRRLLKPYFSPLKDLPGPPSKSFFFGNLEEIRKAENSILHEEWIAQYGKVMKYKAFFNVCVGACRVHGLIKYKYYRETVFLQWT